MADGGGGKEKRTMNDERVNKKREKSIQLKIVFLLLETTTSLYPPLNQERSE